MNFSDFRGFVNIKLSVYVCVCMCKHVCMCVCLCAYVCVCVLHVNRSFIFH